MQPDIDPLLALFEESRHDLKIFMAGVLSYLGEHPTLTRTGASIIHSHKSRIKDTDHLRNKIIRKCAEGRLTDVSNLFTEITDLAGVRILHLYQENFGEIDAVIRKKVDDGDWHFGEQPRAYTWDPEVVEYFKGFDLAVSEKPSSYTSVHYLIKPRLESRVCCELQVRTLFEEIWGEVDHQINYPKPTSSLACSEQLKVLSKIVGAGSRLLDGLRRVHMEDTSK